MNLLTPFNLIIAFIALNFMAFAAFGLDKAKAERGHYRIAESTLLLFAFLGGTLGAYAGRSIFRHKTRKQPFSSNLHQIAMLQIVALAGLGAYVSWRSAAAPVQAPPRQHREHGLLKKPYRDRHSAKSARPTAQPRTLREP